MYRDSVLCTVVLCVNGHYCSPSVDSISSPLCHYHWDTVTTHSLSMETHIVPSCLIHFVMFSFPVPILLFSLHIMHCLGWNSSQSTGRGQQRQTVQSEQNFNNVIMEIMCSMFEKMIMTFYLALVAKCWRGGSWHTLLTSLHWHLLAVCTSAWINYCPLVSMHVHITGALEPLPVDATANLYSQGFPTH